MHFLLILFAFIALLAFIGMQGTARALAAIVIVCGALVVVFFGAIIFIHG
jgi:hypothetical protein